MTDTPDEPVMSFTLSPRDPMAVHFIRLWASFRRGDFLGALEEFNELAQSDAVLAYASDPEENQAEAEEADAVADRIAGLQ